MEGDLWCILLAKAAVAGRVTEDSILHVHCCLEKK